MKVFGFTLAEVLITLGIIGVVAVMTLPNLITYNKEKGWDATDKVFLLNFGTALRVMNTDKILAGYSTTEAFIDELQKHVRISKVCQNDELTQCFPDQIKFGESNSDENLQIVDVNSLTTSSALGHSDWNTNVVGILIANGVTVLIAYNPTCDADPYKYDSVVIVGEKDMKFGTVHMSTSCLAMLYDVSGATQPNIVKQDVRVMNVPNINGILTD